jgi:hypothetical protein
MLDKFSAKYHIKTIVRIWKSIDLNIEGFVSKCVFLMGRFVD